VVKKIKIRPIDIIYFISIVAFDILIFFVLGLLFMSYDDNYDNTKGKYMSLKSMTTFEIIIYALIKIWWLINFFLVARFSIKFYKKISTKPNSLQ
jgi:hypothetical protein